LFLHFREPAGDQGKIARTHVDGVKTVRQLRSQYGEPKKQLTDPSKYFDLGYYDKSRLK